MRILSSCRYDLDYGSFTAEELLSWNITERVAGVDTVGCASWDYDFSEYYSSAVSKVRCVRVCGCEGVSEGGGVCEGVCVVGGWGMCVRECV